MESNSTGARPQRGAWNQLEVPGCSHESDAVSLGVEATRTDFGGERGASPRRAWGQKHGAPIRIRPGHPIRAAIGCARHV